MCGMAVCALHAVLPQCEVSPKSVQQRVKDAVGSAAGFGGDGAWVVGTREFTRCGAVCGRCVSCG
jgi:hypothetical protein